MDQRETASFAPGHEHMLTILRRLEWARNLDETTQREFVSVVEQVEFQSSEVIIELESKLTHIYFVVSGRIHTKLYDMLGKVIQEGIFKPGEVCGLFSIMLDEGSQVLAKAVEPTVAFRITLKQLIELGSKYPDFQLTILGMAAGIMKRVVSVDRSLAKPSRIGVVHFADATRPITQRLVQRLHDLGESVSVAGDDPRWTPSLADARYYAIMQNGQLIDYSSRQEILSETSAGRLFIDIQAGYLFDDLVRFIHNCDTILWCLAPAQAEQGLKKLGTVLETTPWGKDKVCVVWLLDEKNPVAPYFAETRQLSDRDFKLSFSPPNPGQGSLLGHGLDRILHHLRGIRIGLALGGGAARGMAHLGVLKALERQGIYVDMMAGTSAGAMTGIVYASGLDPEFSTQCFKTDLKPSWFFRRLPGCGYWYLLHKYRRKLFDPMLRKYLHQYRMEQLALPIFSISVDLVEGELLIRETGDATHNILESINLPPLSRPIEVSGMAVVDGGLLKNVPADVLVQNGCNFVIASTVTAKLEKDFMGVRSAKARRPKRFFTTLQVLMRQQMIQNYKMNAVGVQPADVVIAPDVTTFDLSEFTRADEMAVIGEAAADTKAFEIRRMLSKLDSKLFKPPVAGADV